MGKKHKSKRARRADEDFSHKALERSMQHGVDAYCKKLGRWWLQKAEDDDHVVAYRHIARWLREHLPRVPKSILDYACGAGQLTVRLREVFPRSHITGYDGASKLLAQLRERMADDKRLHLESKFLPELDDPHPPVDLSILCFPHLLAPDDERVVKAYARLYPREAAAAKAVSKQMRKEGLWDTDESLAWYTANTLYERMGARHLRALTRGGGHCARVGYSHDDLAGIDETYIEYLRFIEGYGATVCDIPVPQFFTHVDDVYVESPVISDVDEQLGEESESGGYMICLLQAVG